MELTNWKFTTVNLEENNDLLFEKTEGEEVTVPHTWSTDKRYEKYMGKCFYSTSLELKEIAEYNILRFEAVYRDAEIFINGEKVFEHKNSGYTPFEFDATPFLKLGKNILTVSVDNEFSQEVLPNDVNFDWASDGGIIRAVTFEGKSETDIKDITVTPRDMKFFDENACSANIDIKLLLFKKGDCKVDLTIKDQKQQTISNLSVKTDKKGEIRQFMSIDDGIAWSPENPYLYTLEIKTPTDTKEVRFGIRELKTSGGKIVFNGKEITLRGVEWMPGSNPDYGMAEPKEISIGFLKKLKKIHCNFTRFHWQQADFVYDWCDENGLMVQEEIPYWGSPKKATKVQFDAAYQQEKEMYAAHKNHTSIVCWGVGNELGGGFDETIRYVYEAVTAFRKIDNTRLVNFVSNTLHTVDGLDATMFGDICMWNEYLGLWYPTLTDVDKWIGIIKDRCCGKPFMISEAGLCEPKFSGGDTRRSQIYRQREEIYKKHKLNGWIYFCLNDYRTHMGEQGEGNLCERVHGSTDLYGNEKPSLKVLEELFSKKI